MTVLYTNYQLVTLTIDEFNSFSGIQAAPDDITTAVHLDLLHSGLISFLDKLGALSARILGTIGGDTITAGIGSDTITGGKGNDVLFGLQGIDRLHGDIGDDRLYGGRNSDKLFGGDGNDQLFGGSSNDTMYGGSGDTLIGGAGNDTYYLTEGMTAIIVEGEAGGIDTLYTDREVNSPIAGLENITAIGNDNARLTGNDLANVLIGNEFANTFFGNGGNDTMTGGAFIDAFFFSDTNSVDRITDFNTADDDIMLNAAWFDGLAFNGGGPIAASEFKEISTGIVDSSDRILYNFQSGKLFYDADGAGGVDSVLFAILQGLPFLTASDINLTL